MSQGVEALRLLRRPRLRPWLEPAAILLLSLIAYWPALSCGFVWDDAAIEKNTLLRSWSGLWTIWTDPSAHPFEEHWWPLLHTSFWIEYQLWGLHPLGYHLVNVLLHGLNSVLIGRLLHRLGAPGAWFAAALFAVHPVHAESVAWVIERKDALSTAFYLGAVLQFLQFRGRRSMRSYWASLGLFACAMLTKSVAVTLPIVLLLLMWWKKNRLEWRDAAAVLPFAVVAVVLEVVSLGVMGAPRALQDAELDSLPAFAWPRWLIAGRALAFYAAKLIWPANLMPIYPRWALQPSTLAEWAPIIILGATVLALCMTRRSIGNGPLVAVMFFALTLGPTLGLVNFGHMRYAFVADRFAYLASLGLLALMAGLAAVVTRRLEAVARLAAWPAGAAILALLAVLTWRQSGIYRDNETLWRFAVQRNQGAWAAHYNLGVALSNTGNKLSEAIQSLERGIELKPEVPDIHNSLAIALAKDGRAVEAERHFRRAIELDPEYADAHYNLGFLRVQQQEFELAIRALREAIRVNPNVLKARSQLAIALSAVGAPAGAIREFREAYRLAPDQPDAPFNLGVALLRADRPAEAVEPFKAALRLRPAWPDARCELGVALIRSGQVNEGVAQLLQVLRANPSHARARDLLENTRAPTSGPAPSRP